MLIQDKLELKFNRMKESMVIDLRDKYTDYHEDWYRMIAYYNGKRIVQDHLSNI